VGGRRRPIRGRTRTGAEGRVREKEPNEGLLSRLRSAPSARRRLSRHGSSSRSIRASASGGTAVTTCVPSRSARRRAGRRGAAELHSSVAQPSTPAARPGARPRRQDVAHRPGHVDEGDGDAEEDAGVIDVELMDRRRFLLTSLGSVVSVSVVAEAQPSGKRYRIGVLERTSPEINAANLDGFRRGLQMLGYIGGKDYNLEYRSADGRDERFPSLATELVRLKVDLILTRGTPAALAAKHATASIPVVFVGVGDPVAQGVVASLARPGANITGLSAAVTEVYAKRVQLLRELVPKAARIAALFNMSNPALPPQWKEVAAAARSLAIEPELLDVRKPEDLEPAFDVAVKHRADALIVGLETLTQANQGMIVNLAAKRRLPAIYGSSEFVGGLISYGVNYPETYRHAATFVHRILSGVKPADLPVQEPTKFDLVINLKTAKALGLTIPQSLLFRADQVIE
jgi:putative ABC transport system substrate-binding protein